MSEFIDENGDFTEGFRESLPERLGDDYYNDPETKQKPTKEFDNIHNVFDMAKMVVTGSRKISAHGEQLKRATEGYVKVPGEGATPEEEVAYREARGVPKDKDGYELTIPEKDKEGYEVIADKCKDAALKAGISPSNLATVWDEVVPALAAQVEAQIKAGQDLIAADVQALKDAKKEGYDSFISDTNKVASHFDVKADEQAGIKGNPVGTEFMKLMKTFGIADTPVVRNFLGSITPLVLEGSSHVGGQPGGAGGEGWFTNYDETGQVEETV